METLNIAKFAMFGAGKIGESYVKIFSEWGIKPEFICDNDPSKIGHFLEKIPIVPPGHLQDKQVNNVIITCKNIEEIKEQLNKFENLHLNIYSRPNLFEIFDFIANNYSFEKSDRKLTALFDLSGGMILGGVEQWSIEQAAILRKMGLNVRYVVPEKLTPDSGHGDDFIDIIRSDFVQTEKYFISRMPFVAIINFPFWFAESVFKLKKCRPDGIKVIAVIHNDEDIYYDTYLQNQEYIDKLLYISDRMLKRIIKKGFSMNKLLHLKWNIPCKKQLSRIYSDEKKPLKIGYAGRVTLKQKRSDLLLFLVDKLLLSNVSFILTIAGDGDYLEDMRSIAYDKGWNKNIIFLGKISRKDIPDFWENMDIAINVSEWEGKSISISEAMASGTVPIVTDTSGAEDDINIGSNGYIVPIGDIDSIVAIIKDINENRWKVAYMGERAHETILNNNAVNMDIWSDLLS